MNELAVAAPLPEDAARSLADAARGELPAIMAAARAVRERTGGTTVTYSPKVFIPLTKACRDVCHYCTFARPPAAGKPVYLRPDEVLDIARRGAAAGCTEGLFTLGDKPERRFRRAREELAALGHATTLGYVRACAELVLEETGLLPHINAGVMSADELAMLRPVAASMGLMLESTSERLLEPGRPHHGSPDKVPARRLETLDAAGRLDIPFTTGLLVGIGETRGERIDALLAIRAAHRRHGHVQEVIVQNFRAKPGTLMAEAPEPAFDELLWTVAVARLILDDDIAVQAPPNLSDERFGDLLEAGIGDWGGVSPVTPDHVNPEAPWPEIDALRTATEARGLRLAPRLTVYPEYLCARERWLAAPVAARALALSDASGLARTHAWRVGDPTVTPRVPDLRSTAPATPRIAAALAAAAGGEELGEDDIVALLQARGPDLAAVCAAADALRRETVGDAVSFVVNRNINYTNVCYFRCGFCAFSKGRLAGDLRGKPYLVPYEEIARRTREAWERGATEVCLQGGIHPAFDGEFYLGVLRAVKQAVPDIHVHAFSPLEIWQGAATLGLELEEYLARLRDAGLGSLPGTSAEILDDEVRAIICPDKNTTEQWVDVMLAAHRAGLPSTSTMMFGHVETPPHWARHLVVLREAQKRGLGFTEFVPLPFVHMEAPIARRGLSRQGPTMEEVLAVHAVARLALHPWITNIQTSWVKLGVEGARAVLNAGANDIGGALMNESISRAAGAAHGQELMPEAMEHLVAGIGRTLRQRTTLYGDVPVERRRAARSAPPLVEPHNPPAREAGLSPRRDLVRPGLI